MSCAAELAQQTFEMLCCEFDLHKFGIAILSSFRMWNQLSPVPKNVSAKMQVVKTKLFAKAYHRPGNLLPLLFHYRKPISLKNGTRTFHCIDLQRNFVLNSFKNTKAS